MLVRELIKSLQDLGEECQEKEIWMFDGPSIFTPYKVEVITEDSGFKNNRLIGNVLID